MIISKTKTFKSSIHGRIVAAAVIWLVGMAVGCSKGTPTSSVAPTPAGSGTAETGATTDDQADEHVEPAAANGTGQLPILGTLPPFQLVEHRDRIIGNEELRGKVWVAQFFFTRCQGTCPRQLARMLELAEACREKPYWQYLRLVNFTVDPEYDTPEILRQRAEELEATETQWVFVTGTRADLWDLCNAGFKLPVQSTPDDTVSPILHAPTFALVDPIGRIRGYYNGLDDVEVQKLLADTDALWSEQIAFPEEILDPEWLSVRQQAQLAGADSIMARHDFGFVDRVIESGIRFRHFVVADSAEIYKAVHYDHGNGLAVADVNGDSREDLYFISQLGRNELWTNNGDGTFTDATESAGVAVDDRIGVSASFADIDNDGDPDLFVTTVRGGNLLFKNDGTGRFEDITDAAGVGYVGHSSTGVFFDYDRDGWTDLFVCNVGIYTQDEQGAGGYYIGFTDAFSGHLKPERNERSILYRNINGERFEDVTEQTELIDVSWSGDALPIDVNADGWTDLYVLNMQGNDEYYENVEGNKFVKRSREVFPKTPWGAMGIAAADFDNDGDRDLLITDMHSDMSKDIMVEPRSEVSLNTFFLEEEEKSTMQLPESLLLSGGMSIFGNALHRNDGDDGYTEISQDFGAENYWPWGLSVGDLNADGFVDAFVASSMNYPYRYAINSLWLNEAGQRFADAEFILGVEPRRDRRTAIPWFIQSCPTEDAQGKKICGDRSGEFIVWGAVGTRSSAIFDIDDDGDLDIVTNEFNDVPMVLVSDLAQRGDVHWLKLRLSGTQSNRDGLGARVTIHVGGEQRMSVNDGKTGYLTYGKTPLYFGLGDIAVVDRIEVAWPSGKSQTVEGPIESGSNLLITEPDD